MRRRLIVLAVILVAIVAADFGFRAYAEGKFAADIRDGLGLREKPDLDLGGFPFFVAMARGRLPSATVHADGVTYDGLRVERFDVELKAVRFSAVELLGSGDGTIRAANGSGTARVTAEDMTAYLMFKGYPGRVTFGDGVATMDAEILGFPIRATGPLSIDRGRLVFEPTEVEAGGAPITVDQVAFAFELQRPFEGFDYSGVQVRNGEATLRARVTNATILIDRPAA
ncbi:MAG: DUF2993 domain-containing protein [Actinomycetota bacterium]